MQAKNSVKAFQADRAFQYNRKALKEHQPDTISEKDRRSKWLTYRLTNKNKKRQSSQFISSAKEN